MSFCVVIMAGGAGTRFWPLGDEDRPKQFLRLFGERSLIQQSFDRVAGMVSPDRIFVLTHQRYVDLARADLPELPPENIVGEPSRRDTAAAAVLAALIVERRFGPATVLATLTADHLIQPVARFQAVLKSAVAAAAGDEVAAQTMVPPMGDSSSEGPWLYTFGIKPTWPATGFGYLERGAARPSPDGIPHAQVSRFREKPNRETAEAFLETGNFLWNSGMFVWRAEALLAEAQRHLPDHVARLRPAVAQFNTPTFASALTAAFEPLKKISVDFAILEKAQRVAMVEADFQWNDVGGWLALAPFLADDGAGNRHRGTLAAHAATDNIVFSEADNELVALVGVRDLVVVRAGQRTLVCHAGAAEDVKKLVETLDPRWRGGGNT